MPISATTTVMTCSLDCVRVIERPVRLVFADPPFNIGYDYDIYDDRREAEAYLEWTWPGVARLFVPSSPTARSGWRSATSTPPS